MPGRPDTDDYRTLFLGDVPMMDMRAPAEFAHGAFPCATSLPQDERSSWVVMSSAMLQESGESFPVQCLSLQLCHRRFC